MVIFDYIQKSLDKKRKMALSFTLLFGLVPYRLLGVFGLDIKLRLLFGLICFLFFLYAVEGMVPKLLNSFLLQTFLYFCLKLENYLYSINIYYASFYAAVIPFQLFGFVYIVSPDPVFLVCRHISFVPVIL